MKARLIKPALLGGLLLAACYVIAFPLSLRPQAPQPTVLQAALQNIVYGECGSAPPLPARVHLTIDPAEQQLAESSLRQGLAGSSAKRGSVILLDANSGAIKAMAAINTGAACAKDSRGPDLHSALGPWEPGSVMKPLLIGVALDTGTISADSSYFDPGAVRIKDRIYTNADNYPPGIMTIQDILTKSLNTGAIHVLKTLGHGSINSQARQAWYGYLTGHYRFGRPTGVELAGEQPGSIRPPDGGRQLETQYAAMSFGVGLTVTPLQLAAAYAALVNGGTYYQPHLIAPAAGGRPKIVARQVVKQTTSRTIVTMLTDSLLFNDPAAWHDGYMAGAKSGTASAVGEDQAYKVNANNGTYVGFLGKDKPDYILLVRLDEPNTTGLASGVARVTWTDIANQLIARNDVN